MSTNRLYDEINIGDQASINRVVTPEDLVVFAHASGNLNPMHNPKLDGNADGTNEAIAPSMWVGSLFSAVIGNVLPGIGTLYESQSLEFTDRAHVGESLHVGVTVAEKLENNRIALDCLITRDGEAPIAQGRAVVVAPQTKVTMDDWMCRQP
jgi:Acyl dehydratase